MVKDPACIAYAVTWFNTPLSEGKFSLQAASKYVLYGVFGHEVCPNTQKVHLQGYIYLKRKLRFHSLHKLFPKAHFEPAKLDPCANFIYCTKDGNFVSYGDLREAMIHFEGSRIVDSRPPLGGL